MLQEVGKLFWGEGNCSGGLEITTNKLETLREHSLECIQLEGVGLRDSKPARVSS